MLYFFKLIFNTLNKDKSNYVELKKISVPEVCSTTPVMPSNNTSESNPTSGPPKLKPLLRAMSETATIIKPKRENTTGPPKLRTMSETATIIKSKRENTSNTGASTSHSSYDGRPTSSEPLGNYNVISHY